MFLFLYSAEQPLQSLNFTYEINLTPIAVKKKRTLFFQNAEKIFSAPDTLWEMLDFAESKNVSTLVVNFPYIYMGDEEQEGFLSERIDLLTQKSIKTYQLLSFDENYNYTSAIDRFVKYNKNCYYRNEPNTAYSGAVINGDSLLIQLRSSKDRINFLSFFKKLKEDLQEEQEASLGKFKPPRFYVAFSYSLFKKSLGTRIKFMGLKAPFVQHTVELSDGLFIFTSKENAGAIGAEIGDVLENFGMGSKPFWIVVVLTQDSKLFRMGLEELENLIKNEWWDYMGEYKNFNGFGFYPYEVYRYIRD